MWCPPTPPQDENDIYIDYSLSFMYEMDTIPDIDLPPIYVKREYKRSRAEAGLHADGRRSTKIRKEDNYYAPRSLFDKPSTAIARIRRDLKSQRHRGVFKPNVQVAGLKPQITPKPASEPDCIGEWSILEDLTILNVLVNIQGLPCNLMVLSPGHTPNWDLVAEIVNSCTRTHRSAKQCRWRYETVIQPREEGKASDSPKKQKKMKNAIKVDYLKGPLRYLRTTQLFINDNNMSFTKMMRSRFDCIKAAYLKKAPPPKRHFSNPTTMNPKHLEVLQELGVTSYDQPISPLNIAAMKVNKYREKQRSHLPPPPPPTAAGQSTHQQQVTVPTQTAQTAHTQQQQQIASVQHQLVQANQQQQIQELVQQQNAVTPSAPAQLHTQQLQIQHISNTGIAGGQQQSTATAIVLQHAGNLSQQLQQQTSITSNTVQNQTQVLRGHSGAAQIVKAIVAQPSGLIATSQMLAQQNTTTGTQHVQLQSASGGNLVGAPASVSVVLTTPVQTISSNVQQSHHTQQSSIVSNSTQVGSIVQTLPQSIQQVVPVSQLANVGTVLTTSSNLQPNAGTVTTLNASTLRAQRIVAATSGTLQDVVLQQRSGNPSPTIVSMPNLGQNVTPAQFQAAQLRLAASMSSGSQQVVAKSIPVSSLQQTAKLTPTSSSGNQQAHIQLYRQRQGVKVLQSSSSQGTQSVQTAGGQTALLNAAGTIIQGNIMQASAVTTAVQVQGQKVAVASVPSSSVVTTPSGGTSSVATVHVAQNTGRAQFIKHVGTGKQGVRQVGETDMLLVKRQVIGSHSKTQVLQQGQIFASGSTVSGVQIQQNTQATSTGNVQSQSQGQTQQTQVQQITPQQIATLVKTSSGASASGLSGVSVATGGQPQTVNMALSQLKPGGQIKVTMANQSQMRQLHMQQQLGISRKINRMTQIAPGTQINAAAVASNQQGNSGNAQLNTGASITTQKSAGSVQAQLLHIQNSKALPSSVTVQQIQQVMRQGQQGSLTTTGLVLGKTSVGRVIPVSVASQPNQRQIQVVSATSAQAIAANNIRAQVASGQIKVAPGSSQSQTQQALINAIQQQAAAQQSQRHASPVRIQTTASGNLVAVVQQQALQQQQNIVASNMSANVGASNSGQEVMTINQGTGSNVSSTQQQTTVQQPTTQQVRTLVKKKIMQIRSEKD
ncbi:helicase domino-like [Teleopsis dalmanni]|uniref:helicase domino-like n=1 Tax=Teleopsis dalmanni TaxID=139649 RepID=UPI0018CD4129|nr:helicase domino-like [Teleopsis dalmanni]